MDDPTRDDLEAASRLIAQGIGAFRRAQELIEWARYQADEAPEYEATASRILGFLRAAGPLSRSDLMKRLSDVPRTVVWSITCDLAGEGRVRLTQQDTGGRPRTIVHLVEPGRERPKQDDPAEAMRDRVLEVLKEGPTKKSLLRKRMGTSAETGRLLEEALQGLAQDGAVRLTIHQPSIGRPITMITLAEHAEPASSEPPALEPPAPALK